MGIFNRKVKVSTGFDSPLLKAVEWEKADYYNQMATEAIIRNGAEYISMPRKDYDAMMRSLAALEARNRVLAETAEANNRGIALEKEGRIDEAIAVYEENVSRGYPAAHSYQRLMVLYRKRGDLTNERRITKAALEMAHKNGLEAWEVVLEQRLNKIKE